MSRCIINGCVNIRNIPLFSFPKNEEKLKEWERKIFPEGTSEMREEARICIRHFEKKFIEKNNLLPTAIPTLELSSFSKGNTIDDFEELLQAQKPTMKKKRGSSGLKNLQIAREKRNQRKERMKKIAEMRRLAKSARNSRQSSIDERNVQKEPVYDVSTDYFLGDSREETEQEKVLIGLRLPQNLHDGKTNLKTSSIRNVQSFPLFNSIKHMDTLVENPVFWDTDAALSFIRIFAPLKNIEKVFKFHEVTGETILNLTKSDLVRYLKLDEKNASVLGEKFEQLRKETIMRYISS